MRIHDVVTRRGLRGFSLIELMVAVSIMLILAALGSSLTQGWTDTARVREANHRLLEGMGRVKALALANAGSATDDHVAAALVLVGQQLCVWQGAPETLTCAGSPNWLTTTRAVVVLNGASSQCVALNSRAVAMGAQIGSVQCGTGLGYSISSGSERFPASGSNVLY